MQVCGVRNSVALKVEVVEIRRCYGLVWLTASFTGRILVVAALFDSAEKIIRIFRSDIWQGGTHCFPNIIVVLGVIFIGFKERRVGGWGCVVSGKLVGRFVFQLHGHMLFLNLYQTEGVHCISMLLIAMTHYRRGRSHLLLFD